MATVDVTHVLHLDHTPAVAIVRALGRTGAAPCAVETGAPARGILGLDPCRLCNGTRRCPDCGGPCEVCTLRDGARGAVRR